jgi:hypothetical protein
MALLPTDTVSRSTRVAQRLFEDRMLVITAGDSMLHRFNEAGTFIWQLLEKPRTISAINTAVSQHFEGFNPAKDSDELCRFLEQLMKKKCVEIAPTVGG